MSRTAEDVETYLLQLDRRFELENGTFLLSSGPSVPPIAIRVVPPIVAVRVLIGPVPGDDAHKIKLFTRLLEYNATDLMHSSYGIEDGTIVLSAALALDNLDKNELEATLSDIDVALARHVSTLHDIAVS
ncbi:MAG: hypothetical protein HUU21_22555 [Polyangiaceae bacterium]|nr:YbjN domain-containing protein [Polyangiaceae bacterium]NUQ76329.1 hypothetical protein [Polyangiaceae bacterium]